MLLVNNSSISQSPPPPTIIDSTAAVMITKVGWAMLTNSFLKSSMILLEMLLKFNAQIHKAFELKIELLVSF